MLMMTRGGKSGSMAPVMMTGGSLEYKKNPATEPKWKDLPNKTTCCFREIPDYRLPIPMPQPIVANIRGKVYVLHGDPITGEPGCPGKPELAFQVLEFDHCSKSYRWRTLPIPPFYDVYSSFFGEWRGNVGVVGPRLFMLQLCEGVEIVHIFDSVKETWESQNEDEFPLDYMPCRNLSSLLISQRTERGSGMVHATDGYFIAIGNECQLACQARVFATVANFHGVMSDVQFLPDQLPAEFHPLAECNVIDLLEKDHGTSITFCVLYVANKRALLALSVFRVWLLSSMVVVKPEDGSPYLSREDKGEGGASDDGPRGGAYLGVEILETHFFSMGEICPIDIADAFFL
ncbi:unnamed protein product [Linum tenue]|uniref:Uncharacterized protein n=1 Tax=Linum tenue TaxID=586396 RepID=A0AAV0RAS8_9ROSI|nr:unnamed protein product [Linum tenue]